MMTRKKMRRQNLAIVAGAFVAVGMIWQLGSLVTPEPESEPEPRTWEESDLPEAMYEHVEKHGADLVPVEWFIDASDNRHAGCWHAVADTTLTMCPDGYVTTS